MSKEDQQIFVVWLVVVQFCSQFVESAARSIIFCNYIYKELLGLL